MKVAAVTSSGSVFAGALHEPGLRKGVKQVTHLSEASFLVDLVKQHSGMENLVIVTFNSSTGEMSRMLSKISTARADEVTLWHNFAYFVAGSKFWSPDYQAHSSISRLPKKIGPSYIGLGMAKIMHLDKLEQSRRQGTVLTFSVLLEYHIIHHGTSSKSNRTFSAVWSIYSHDLVP